MMPWMPTMPRYPDNYAPTAEVLILRAVDDLNLRMAHEQSAERRTKFRESIAVLVAELHKVLDLQHIVTEDQIKDFQKRVGQGFIVGSSS